MATTSDIKNGAVFLHKGKRMKVTEFLHVKPGKGPAFVRTKLKDLKTGKTIDETFNAGMKLEFLRIEARTMQFLYDDGDSHVFMDVQTYDQLNVPNDLVESASKFLKGGMKADLLFDGDEVLDVRISAHVELEVTHTEPAVRGNTATGATKPATLETGYTVQVPLFVEIGDLLKIDTRSGDYVERVKS